MAMNDILNCVLVFNMTDAARFGSNYVSKFGWDPSKGLGVGGEGRTSHIKVAQKLDMMGIGAAHQADPNGVAWKQNKDFENLLKRLNQADGSVEGGYAEEEANTGVVISGFVQQKDEPRGEEEESGEEEEKVKDGKGTHDSKKKSDEQTRTKDKGKRKNKDDVETKKKKRKRDGDETDKKSKKKKKSSSDSTSEDKKQEELSPPPLEPTPAVEQKTTRIVPRHRS